MNNWFTSVNLEDDLIKKKIQEIPPLFTSVKKRPVYGSYFGFAKNKTLVSYKANKN